MYNTLFHLYKLCIEFRSKVKKKVLQMDFIKFVINIVKMIVILTNFNLLIYNFIV